MTKTVYFVCALWASAFSPAGAQTSVPAGGFTSTVLAIADSARKSPSLAGSLSFVAPFGTGSFYAEHWRHGVRHLAIGAAAAVVGLVANDRLSRNDAETGSALVLISAGVAFLVNWTWGTITAVGDAKAFNRRATGQGPTDHGFYLEMGSVEESLLPARPGLVARVRLSF